MSIIGKLFGVCETSVRGPSNQNIDVLTGRERSKVLAIFLINSSQFYADNFSKVSNVYNETR